MRDSEVVASVVGGDPDGLAEAYDRYADSLYRYCLFLLGDPADAADTVQDTFVIAASRLGGLGEPDQLRAWLYAVARNECLRTLRARKTAAVPADTPHAAGEGAGEGTEHAALAALIEDAAQGLSPAERELVELHLAHGLADAEIAAVLGVSRERAHTRTSRAVSQLQACLGVLVVGRASPADCAELGTMLGGWDGIVTPALSWWAQGHIARCKTCTARRAAELGPVMPPELSPEAAIAAAAAQNLRLAAGPPQALKEHALALATGQDPSAVAYRAVLLGRVGAFERHGYPKPSSTRLAALRSGGKEGAPRGFRQLRTVAAAGLVAAVAVAAVAVALTRTSAPTTPLAEGTQPAAAATAPVTSAPATSPTPSASPGHRQAVAPHTRAGKPTPSASGKGSAGGTARPPTPTPSSASPTPTPTPTSTRPTPAPTATPTTTPSPTAGTLIVNPAGGQLQVSPFGASITLTAQGASVNWSIAVSDGSGLLMVHPSSGTLRPGDHVTVTIFASRHASGRQLTVTPGGTVFTIETGWKRSGEPGRPGSHRRTMPLVTLPSGRIVFRL